MLYEYLREHYQPGEPIFSLDIEYPEMTKDNLRQQLKQLTDKGRLARYADGIYYFPKVSKLAGSAVLSSEDVIQSKYILRKGQRIGYYSGHTFANQLGLSTQVPAKKEIVSNIMTSIVREVPIGNQSVVVRKPKVEITEENYKVLQLLEVLKDIGDYIDGDTENAKRRLAAYVKATGISRNQVNQYIKKYPAKTYKNLFEMGLDDVLA